jgi:hypothetical protein
MSKKSKVSDITTGGPLGPNPEHIFLTVLYKIHFDPDILISRVAAAVPVEYWENVGPETAVARIEYARTVADQLVYEMAENEIENSIHDARMHSDTELDDEYISVLAEAAMSGVIWDRLPRTREWSEGMTDEEVDDRIVEMLREKVSEMLGH